MVDDDLAVGSTLGMTPGATPGGTTTVELELGTMLGRFRLQRRLGAGGMGVVFAGEDVQLGRPVAIKVVKGEPAQTGEHQARLLREAQALARLEHPNVVRVYEVDTDRARLFIAMEYVDGPTLTQWQRELRPWQDVLAMYRQVGAGLAAVHHAGLVHRDFKPDNVLVDRAGHARVADFGLARLTATDARSPMAPLTGSGVMMGTPGYMAPEQMVGSDVDARADQYSFCVALREALGGRPLDDARWNLVPRPVRDAINRGLSYDPDERYPTIDELLGALGRPTAGTDPRWLVALLVLFVLGGVAAIVAYASSRHGGTPGHVATADTTSPLAGNRAAATADAGAAAPDDGPRLAATEPDAAIGPDRLDLPPPPTPTDEATPAPPSRPRSPAPTPPKPHDGIPPTPPVTLDAGAPPTLTVQMPTTKHLAVAHVGDPGHLPIVRAATTDLGYDGIDLRELPTVERDATAALASASGTDLGIAQVEAGMVKRRHGDCSGAEAMWRDAMKTLRNDDPDPAPVWLARAYLGTSLCQLGWGRADAAWDTVAHAWVHGNRDEVSLLMGFIAYEQGKKDTAYGLLLTADRIQNAKVQAALHTWLDKLGLGLH